MKELEDKISDILDNIEWCYHGIDGRTETQTLLVKEVKDIAIEFAEFIRFNATEIPDGWQVNGKGYNSEELFDQFIKQRYATT